MGSRIAHQQSLATKDCGSAVEVSRVEQGLADEGDCLASEQGEGGSAGNV